MRRAMMIQKKRSSWKIGRMKVLRERRIATQRMHQGGGRRASLDVYAQIISSYLVMTTMRLWEGKQSV
jgi:hypothetical protein